MEVDIHGAPVYFEIPILGGIPITASMVGTWCVMLVLTLLCVWLTHDLQVRNISKRQAVAEKIVMMAENFVRANMGEQWMDMVPMIAALFSLSLGSSLLSLLGLWAPTADVSVLLGWALIVFMLITYYKIKTNGFLGYLKGFCDPVFPMAPFNVLGEVFKPISMSFRHFGNVLLCHQLAGLCRTHFGESCAVRAAARCGRRCAREHPIPGRRRAGGALAVFRLVLQFYAGVYFLHADDDLHPDSCGIK